MLSIPSWSDFNHFKRCVSQFWGVFFQSHLGLISTVLRKCPYVFRIAFNPILVWFQLTYSEQNRKTFKSFNPILVWFQLNSSYPYAMTFLTFNPILVWFQQRRVYHLCDEGRNIFQSHLGLISTRGFQRCVWPPLRFQSHLGLISTFSETAGCSTHSVPFNPILVWFQRNEGARTFTHATYAFQSHLGLISTRLNLQIYEWFSNLSIPSWSDFNMMAK